MKAKRTQLLSDLSVWFLGSDPPVGAEAIIMSSATDAAPLPLFMLHKLDRLKILQTLLQIFPKGTTYSSCSEVGCWCEKGDAWVAICMTAQRKKANWLSLNPLFSSLAADNGIKSTDDIDDRACVRQSVCPFLIHHISVSDVSEPLFLTRSVHSHCTSWTHSELNIQSAQVCPWAYIQAHVCTCLVAFLISLWKWVNGKWSHVGFCPLVPWEISPRERKLN